MRELVTPTLGELLAVARAKPLPRFRERTPPPVRVGASLKGWLEWRLVNRAGREVAGGEGPNLVLDQGLDQVATTALLSIPSQAAAFPIIEYAAVGTDSAAPDASDTGLGSEAARVNTTFAANELTRPSPGVYQLIRHIEFDYAVGNGVLTEWGFSNSASAGSNLFNRALFVDGMGDPEAITKTDEEKLRVTYTLEVALSPVSFTAGSFSVTNVGTVNGDYALVGAGAPSPPYSTLAAPDLCLFGVLAHGPLAAVGLITDLPMPGGIVASTTDLSDTTYTSNLTVGGDTSPLLAAREVLVARDAYTPGSFERTGGAWKWDTAYGNANPLRGFKLPGVANTGVSLSAYGYVFDLDPGDEFAKDDEHTLTIGAPTVSWGRAP